MIYKLFCTSGYKTYKRLENTNIMCTGTNGSHWETTCNGEKMEENKLKWSWKEQWGGTFMAWRHDLLNTHINLSTDWQRNSCPEKSQGFLKSFLFLYSFFYLFIFCSSSAEHTSLQRPIREMFMKFNAS